MLNELLLPLREYFGFLNLFEYITFRAGASAILALLISFIFGPFVVKKLINLQIGESIRDHGPDSHKEKQGTPTMGGVLIILSTIIPTILLADLNNLFIQIICISMVWMGLVGFYDDYLKVVKKRKDGLSGRYKLLAQTILGVFISYILISSNVYGDYTLLTFVPFLKNVSINFFYPIIYAVFIILVVSATSNAVNLTDGLDGLAILPTVLIAGALGLIAYSMGNQIIADYLYLPHLELSGELIVFCGALIGSGIGFLWYNTYPAQIFMGDIGSLTLGAILGIIAIILRHELVFAIMAGVFVIETLSVAIQVISYKTRGKRVFLMAPIHHHYELKGWPEPKIIVRFWIVTLVFILIALATLKLR